MIYHETEHGTIYCGDSLDVVQNGRRYIGIDLNPEYCAIAAKRIDSELQQTNIFREMTCR